LFAPGQLLDKGHLTFGRWVMGLEPDSLLGTFNGTPPPRGGFSHRILICQSLARSWIQGRKLQDGEYPVKRLLVGLAGALILCLSALFTLGIALAAPVGVLTAAAWASRRGQRLTLGRSWLAAAIASSLALVGVFAVAAARAPEGALQRFQQAAAEREAAPAVEPPAWLARVFPQATRQPDPLTERVLKSRALTVYFGLMGAGMAVVLLGAIVGSFGWAGTMLLGRAFSRRLAA